MKYNKGIGVIDIILIIAGILVVSGVVNYSKTDSKVNVVTNFTECVDEGNPVMESYPRQCRHGNETFTEIIDDNFVIQEENNNDAINNSWSGSDKFVFIEDYKVEQPIYNGGDFPSGTKITIFKKGDVIEGKYGIVGCRGVGCIPPEVVRVVINGQNWAIDKTILVPYKN